MAVKRKTSPVGIDFEIDKFMAHFPVVLVFPNAYTSDWFPRIYVNRDSKNRTGDVPDHFDFDFSNNNDYKEVLMNDKIDLTCFFVAEDTATIDKAAGTLTQRVSVIFQVNLKNLYPGIAHRADEEFHMNIYNMWKAWPLRSRFDLIDYETRIENVFREFATDKITFEDMQPRHCVRFNFNVTYKPKCCTDC